MTMVTDIRHFIDTNGNRPANLGKWLDVMGELIETVSVKPDAILVTTQCQCRYIGEDNGCEGYLEAWIGEGSNIHWGCDTCDKNGEIHHWQHSPWDKRSSRFH